jgi:hypothetical protein
MTFSVQAVARHFRKEDKNLVTQFDPPEQLVAQNMGNHAGPNLGAGQRNGVP